MPLIPFPDIPKLPGVPSIPRTLAGLALSRVNLGFLGGILWRLLQVDTQWGVFDKNGNALGDPATFTGIVGSVLDSIGIGSTLSTSSVDYSKETKIADFPVEKGSFANYNKVELPANPVITLCLSGTESDRTSFLTEIDKAAKSTDLYSVVTPEITYADYNIERYNYQRRSSRGATLLIVELTLREIRQVSVQYTKSNKSQVDKPKAASADPKVDNGKVQAQTPEKSTLKKAYEALPGIATSISNLAQKVIR